MFPACWVWLQQSRRWSIISRRTIKNLVLVYVIIMVVRLLCLNMTRTEALTNIEHAIMKNEGNLHGKHLIERLFQYVGDPLVREKFFLKLYYFRRVSYVKDFGAGHQGVGPGTRQVFVMIRISRKNCRLLLFYDHEKQIQTSSYQWMPVHSLNVLSVVYLI